MSLKVLTVSASKKKKKKLASVDNRLSPDIF